MTAPTGNPEGRPRKYAHLAHLPAEEYNREAQKIRYQEYAKSGRSLDADRRRKYGVSAEQIHSTMSKQGGLCAICQNAPATSLDHCHGTKRFRGLLCGSCNRAIGLLQDDPERCRRAAMYLVETAHSAQPVVIHKPLRGPPRKVTAAQVLDMRRNYRRGGDPKTIAQEVGLSPRYAYDLMKGGGRTWKNVK